jgi:hypothetical protein
VSRAPLAQASPAQAPQAPPTPRLAVGDHVEVGHLQVITKTVVTDEAEKYAQFFLTLSSSFVGEEYLVKFPPNDASYVPELDRLLTISATVNRSVFVSARMEVTQIIGNAAYEAMLQALTVQGQAA